MTQYSFIVLIIYFIINKLKVLSVVWLRLYVKNVILKRMLDFITRNFRSLVQARKFLFLRLKQKKKVRA